MDVARISSTRPSAEHARGLRRGRVGEILGSWQAVEVQAARSYPECWGLGVEQIEDLYQETVIALLSRPYASEAHLRNALRQGLRHRALNLHRDTRRRGRILAENAPGIQRAAESHAEGFSPETMALRSEERAVVLDFLGELDTFEREVFALRADGLGYRAIAKQLGVEVNEARRTSRAIERKRAAFRLRSDLADRDLRHGRRPLLLAPVGLLACGVESARRWLFGAGLSAKAGAVAATVAVIATGTAHVLEGGGRHLQGGDVGRPVLRAHPRSQRAVGYRLPAGGRALSRRATRLSAGQRMASGAVAAERAAAVSGPRVPRRADPDTPAILERAPAVAATAEFGFER